jgi:hypothetical protein
MGVGYSNPRNVERRIPKEIQEKSTSPVFGKGVYQTPPFFREGLPVALRESGFEGASARSHLGQV